MTNELPARNKKIFDNIYMCVYMYYCLHQSVNVDRYRSIALSTSSRYKNTDKRDDIWKLDKFYLVPHLFRYDFKRSWEPHIWYQGWEKTSAAAKNGTWITVRSSLVHSEALKSIQSPLNAVICVSYSRFVICGGSCSCSSLGGKDSSFLSLKWWEMLRWRCTQFGPHGDLPHASLKETFSSRLNLGWSWF